MHNVLLPSCFYLKTNVPEFYLSLREAFYIFIGIFYFIYETFTVSVQSWKIYQDWSIILHCCIDAKSSKQLTHQVQSSVYITRNCHPFRKTKTAAFHVRSRVVLIAIAHLAIVQRSSSLQKRRMRCRDVAASKYRDRRHAAISFGRRAVILKAWYPRYNYR